jgi:hypothetical protein
VLKVIIFDHSRFLMEDKVDLEKAPRIGALRPHLSRRERRPATLATAAFTRQGAAGLITQPPIAAIFIESLTPLLEDRPPESTSGVLDELRLKRPAPQRGAPPSISQQH